MKNKIYLDLKTGETVTLCLDIEDTMLVEEDIKKSLFCIFSTGIVANMNLNFTISCLHRALKPKCTRQAAIDLIQAHCDAGGTLDEINRALLDTLFATGLFIPQKNIVEAAAKG